MPSMLDAVVVGAGPNGLTAAAELARRGFAVEVFEAEETVGGGARTEELTLPGFRHDPCSAVHPLGIGSPAFNAMPLARHGLEWLQPELALAHPFPDGTAAVLTGSVGESAMSLGARDAGAYRRLVAPYLGHWDTLAQDFLRTPWDGLPRDPYRWMRFGLDALQPASLLSRRFRGAKARGLLAGLAAHAIAPTNGLATGGIALLFALAAHEKGGRCRAALPGHLRRPRLVPTRTGRHDPYRHRGQAARRAAARPRLRLRHLAHRPRPYRRAGQRLPRLPVRRGLLQDRLRPVGPRPLDRGGGPPGRHGPHRPHGRRDRRLADGRGDGPRPERAVPDHRAAQPGRPVPRARGPSCLLGVRTRPLGLGGRRHRRHRTATGAFRPGVPRSGARPRRGRTPELAARNANYIGGDIGCGAFSGLQTVLRPKLARVPYATAHPAVFLCSSATPPGPGVHGMSGHHAAKAVWRRLRAA